MSNRNTRSASRGAEESSPLEEARGNGLVAGAAETDTGFAVRDAMHVAKTFAESLPPLGSIKEVEYFLGIFAKSLTGMLQFRPSVPSLEQVKEWLRGTNGTSVMDVPVDVKSIIYAGVTSMVENVRNDDFRTFLDVMRYVFFTFLGVSLW